jgi:uncharacterized protein (TIGR02246 family)
MKLEATLFLALAATCLMTLQVAGQDRPSDSLTGETNRSRPSAVASSDPASDLELLRQNAQEFAAAFNKHDAEAIAALWTADGDCVDDAGQRYAGREAIEKAYAELFAGQPAVRIQVVIDSLRLLSPDAAIEDGHTELDPAPTGPPARSRYTAVHVKVDGQWRMSTVRESREDTPSGYEKVADLEWLIGAWQAEEHGAKSTSVCRWVANKSFVERKYTVTSADGSATSGVQLIGFNPEAGRVQSWNFNSDGGHAIGTWAPREGGWSAEIRGVTASGGITTAVNTLTRLDENAYVWQSIQRTAGGQSLPDTEEVVLRRLKAAP